MSNLLTVTVPARKGQENEDSFALGDGVAVVIDGAGLPRHLRRGCIHSVRWYADALATAFRDQLVRRDSDMREALAAAIAEVADAHQDTCHLADGSPSATVAAWRLHAETLEYLVLCDASIILESREGAPTEITDDRIAQATTPLIDKHLRKIRKKRDVVAADIREARRAAVEETRNLPGGFWCCHFDPQAAFAARHGWVDRRALKSIIAASDGATRGYQLLGIHTISDVVQAVQTGDIAGLMASIRDGELSSRSVADQGLKQHDDATLVALTLA